MSFDKYPSSSQTENINSSTTDLQTEFIRFTPDSISASIPGKPESTKDIQERTKIFFDGLPESDKMAVGRSTFTFLTYYIGGCFVGLGAGIALARRNPYKLGGFGKTFMVFGTMTISEYIGRQIAIRAARNQIQKELPPDSKLWPFLNHRFGFSPDLFAIHASSNTNNGEWGSASQPSSEATNSTSSSIPLGPSTIPTQSDQSKPVRYNQYGDPILEDK